VRLDAPRILPLGDAELDQEQAALLGPYRNERGLLNIYRTLARQPRAAKAFLSWGRYVLRESDFDARLRELAILRTGWLCKSGYEWTQHSRLARQLGFSESDIERIKRGPDATEWSPLESLVLKATDELHTTQHVGDATWQALTQRLSEQHLMDLVFTVGHYTQVCMILNSFGIQVEAPGALDRDLRVG
jgi:4-carboxymuconolactone decarboxylase